jgi:hypothetical protein
MTGHHGPPLRLAFGLDGLAVAALVAYVVVTEGRGRQDDGFFSDPLPDGLAVLALAAAIAAGAVAAWALVREPKRRGLLLIPLMIGASALIFFLGDLLFPD